MSKTFSLLLFAWLFLISNDLYGQPKIEKNDHQATSFLLFDLIPVPNKGYISLLTDREESPTLVRLAFTGASETVEFFADIPLEQNGLSLMLEGAFLWDGQLAVVTSLFYPGPQRDMLFIRRYRIPDFAETAAEKIAEAYVPGRLRIPFGYSLSPDSTKIMFYSWTYAVPKDPVKMEIHVLDRQLQRIWTKRFLLPNKNENFYIYACHTDNTGNAYLLCEDYKGKVGPGTRIMDEKIERFVLRLAKDSDEATSFNIQLDDKVITDLRFTIDSQGNLIGAGWYREAKKVYQGGIFAYRIDQQTQGFKKWEFPISREDYLSMHPYTDAEGKYVSGSRQLHDFYLDHLVWDQNQGLTLVAEQRIYEEDEDKYNDIMVVRLDTNFRKIWAIRIPKQQATSWTQPDFVSYQFLERNHKQYVLFNDHPDNLPTKTETPRKVKDVNFVYNTPKLAFHLVQIGDSGQLLHQDLNQVLQLGTALGLVPDFLRSDGQNVFLLYLNTLNNPAGMGEVYPISWVGRNEE